MEGVAAAETATGLDGVSVGALALALVLDEEGDVFCLRRAANRVSRDGVLDDLGFVGVRVVVVSRDDDGFTHRCSLGNRCEAQNC